MVIVTIREHRQRPRQQRHFRFGGVDVRTCVAQALRVLYPDGTLDRTVDGAGKHTRVLEREVLLPRKLVITVRVQGELWPER